MACCLLPTPLSYDSRAARAELIYSAKSAKKPQKRLRRAWKWDSSSPERYYESKWQNFSIQELLVVPIGLYRVIRPCQGDRCFGPWEAQAGSQRAIYFGMTQGLSTVILTGLIHLLVDNCPYSKVLANLGGCTWFNKQTGHKTDAWV